MADKNGRNARSHVYYKNRKPTFSFVGQRIYILDVGCPVHLVERFQLRPVRSSWWVDCSVPRLLCFRLFPLKLFTALALFLE